MRDPNRSDHPRRNHALTLWSRFGVTGIALFLLKGLLWLLAPALVALMR